ncbi:MAG: hypothetical protein Q8L85_05750 [Alphaproteobacteria bacterium]|jgi:hypothetical protein|nr:hypothetical protein [Alphaproteobacteria bacterium]MDP3532743.1 hypothetical protein [Alphaproteobacteria bacterium]
MNKSILISFMVFNVYAFQANAMIGEDQLDEVEINDIGQVLPEEEQNPDNGSSEELSYVQRIDLLLNIFF